MVAPVAYTSNYSSPFFGGAAVAGVEVVPGLYNAAINGRPYMLVTDPQVIDSYGDFLKEESLPLLRAQADQAKNPSEQSISPQQFWRRGQETWHKGAGQAVLDRETSDPARFNTSKGIDPWTRYQLSLLKTTTQLRATASTNLFMVANSTRYYVADNQTVYSDTDLIGAPAAVTGTPAAAVTGMATDGNTVFIGYGASGIYSGTAGTAASYVTGTVGIVGHVKGRLLTANNAALYNPIAAGALPAAFYTQPDAGWAWRAFAEGNAFIYAAGDTGARSRIYRTAVQKDGTALEVPVVAATLPSGEVVRSLLGYMGFVIIGTDRGVRFATAENSGDLTLGALIPTPGAVSALEASGQFVWFGWSNYDTVSTGLGRLDLTTINEGLTPAYASDLMATGQGAVAGIVTLGGIRGFSVAGLGIYAEHATTLVASGTLTTGQITFGIADAKVHVQTDIKHTPLVSGTSVALSASHDRATAATVGTSAAVGTVSPAPLISMTKHRSEEVELTFTLTGPGTATGPTMTRWTLMSYPAPAGASIFSLPLQLRRRLITLRDTEATLDPFYEYSLLVALHQSREVVTVQMGNDAFEGLLEEFVWLPYHATFDRGFWDGIFVAKIRRING